MLRPENTMSAFIYAAELGVDVLEFDMLMTADGQIVVHHDAKVNPTFCQARAGSSVKPGAIHELHLSELQEFDCGTQVRGQYDNEKFQPVPGAHPPSLQDVFEVFADSDVLFFPEIKMPKAANYRPEVFAQRFNDLVSRYGLEGRVILQSFDTAVLDAQHQINPNIRTCATRMPQGSDRLSFLQQHNASCLLLGPSEADREYVERLQKDGVTVFSRIADTQEGWEAAVGMGVDAIFTNEPEGLIEFLRQSGLRD